MATAPEPFGENKPLASDAARIVNLETQIAELREQVANYQRIERALVAARGRWHAVVENAAQTVLLLDRDGMILSLHIDGDEESARNVVGAISYQYVEPDHRERMRRTIESVFQTGQPGYYEVKELQSERWHGCRVAPIFREGRVDSVAAICTDITERKAQEEALRQSEERLRLMAEQMPAILWTADMDLRFGMSMGAGLSALGLSRDEVAGMSAWDYFQTRDPEFPAIAAILRGINGTPTRFEQVWQGHVFETYVQPLRDSQGALSGVMGVALDVTERKAAEDSLHRANDMLEQRVSERTGELREANESLRAERRLLKRLLDLHDRDRQLIAYEIHDGMVQDMTGAAMRLEATLASSPADLSASGKRNLSAAIRLIQDSIAEARRMINGLRPPVLEAEGLVSALANLAEENRLNGELNVDLDCRVQFNRIAPALETAIYRIVQEALNNVRKHSQTNRAWVRLAQQGEKVLIEIRDEGVGFDPKSPQARRYGLEGIRERARLLEGKLDIDSAPGRGARLCVELPLTDVLLPDG